MVDARTIAERLTVGQRQTVVGLSVEFCILGCSEPWAIRLLVDKPRRPALVEEGPRQDGYRTFRLRPLGVLVKQHLTTVEKDFRS